MEDNSDIPITVSEVPPQSSLPPAGISRHSRSKSSGLGSPHQLKRTVSSPTKSFIQTPLEPWIERSLTSKRSESSQDSLPPWATPLKTVQQNHSFSIEALPLKIKEEEDSNDSILEAKNNKVGRQNQTEEFSVLSSREKSHPSPDNPEDESEPYCTPHPYFSPEEIYPQFSWAFVEDNKNVGRDENDDTDSQATVPYDYNESVESDSPNLNASLGITIDSQTSEPSVYKPSSAIYLDSQATSTHNYDDPAYSQFLDETDSTDNQNEFSSLPFYQDEQSDYDTPIFPPITELCHPEHSLHSNDLSHNNSQIPTAYTPSGLRSEVSPSPNHSVHNESPANSSRSYHSPFNDTYSPPITSPTQSAKLVESLRYPNRTKISSPQTSTSFGKQLMEAAKINSCNYERSASPSLSPKHEANTNEFETDYNQSSLSSITKRKQKLHDRSIEHVKSRSPVKQQKLNLGSFGSSATEDDNLSTFGDSIKSQETSSAKQKMKKPMPIENYFLNSTSQEESLSDIGRASITPSFLINNEDIKKETAQSSITRTDQRSSSRRLRSGLSKKYVSQ